LYDSSIVLDGGITNLRFDPGESACDPCFGSFCGLCWSIETDNCVCALRFQLGSAVLCDRSFMASRNGIPQRHVDAGEGHRNDPLWAEQAKALGQHRSNGSGIKRLFNECFFEVRDQACGWAERRRREGKDDGVAGNPIVTGDIHQHQGRYAQRTVRRLMWLRQWQENRAHPHSHDGCV